MTKSLVVLFLVFFLALPVFAQQVDTAWVRRNNGPGNSSDIALAITDGFARSYSRVHPDSIPLAPAVNYEVGNYPTSVFCADLDGDGDLDLAVTNALSNNISILKNNGDGSFQTATTYWVGYPEPISVFCADLDGDLDLDLAVANSDYDNISILKNNGDGTFQTAGDYGVGDNPVSVFCADLDGDGDLDLAVANFLGNSVSILKNNSDGTFQSAGNCGVGNAPFSVFCADLDKDYDLDLAVTNYVNGSVSILKNNGHAFETKVDYNVGLSPNSVYCADLNSDGHLDLAVANSGSHNVSILRNNGDGTFQAKVDYNVGVTPRSVFCADLNSDGDLDLAVTNEGGNSVSILRNKGDGTFLPAVNYNTGIYPSSVFCADLDGDGDMDLAVANAGSNSISILINLISRPNSYSLSTPQNADSVNTPVTLTWQKSIDPDPNDTVHYDLYLSRSIVFNPDSTIIYDSLLNTTFSDSLDIKLWYWKVKAYDKWGATRWSDQTWSFYVNSRPDAYSLITPTNADSVKTRVQFKWHNALDPDNDTVHYDLYLSRSIVFEPDSTIVYDSLLDTTLTDSLALKNWYWNVKAYDKWGARRWSEQSWSFYIYLSGDVNADSKVTVSDVVYLINFLFKGGPTPKPYRAGEVNCDGYVTVADVVYLINYLFKSGSPPCS